MKSSWSQEIFVKRNNNNKKIQLTRKSVLQPQTTMIPVQKKGRNKKYRCNLMSTVFSVVLYIPNLLKTTVSFAAVCSVK